MAMTKNSRVGTLATGADSAKEFANQRLREAGETMAPAELADEYGCSSGHMRNVLREMRRDGEVGRPEVGEYEVPAGETIEVDPDGVAGGMPDSDADADAEADAEAPADDSGGVPVGAGAGAAAAGLGAMASGDGGGLSTGEKVLVVAFVAAIGYLLLVDSGSSETEEPDERNRGEFGVFA